MGGWPRVEHFFEDVRYGLRMLWRTPGWTAVVLTALGLGIGVATAIFSLLYSLLLQPLPYPDPEALVALWNTAPERGYPRLNASAANWRDWRAQSKSLEDIALVRRIANFNLTGAGEPERLQGARTSWNLSTVLGVRPFLGRFFTEDEVHRGANVAVLGHGLWLRRFGGDPGLLGRTIELNGERYQVIGIMPADFNFPTREFDLWTPLHIQPEEFQLRLGHDYSAVGRLKPGVTIEQAQAELFGITQRIAAAYPALRQFLGRQDILVEPLLTSTVREVRTPLYVLMGAVALLLFIACLNTSVLLMVRASGRAQEIAVRVALGASRMRLIRQMFAEVIPLGIAGGIGGMVTAWALVHLSLGFLPDDLPRAEAIGLHLPALGFTAAVSVLTVLIVGLMPAWSAARTSPTGAMQSDSRTVTRGGRARNALVVSQVALAFTLLIGEGLLLRSLSSLLNVDPGFTTRNVLTLHLAVTRARYPQDKQVAAYYDRIAQRVSSIPGVRAAGLVNRLPFSGIAQTGPVEFEDHPEFGQIDTDWRSATTGYFDAIGIPLQRGRVFTSSDRENTRLCGVIDAQLARKVFGDRDPIGRRFRLAAASFHGPWVEIVGVVGHIRNDSPAQDARPQVYWPETQRAQDRAVLVVRTAGDPLSFLASVMQEIHKENPDQAVYNVRTMEQWLGVNLQIRNLITGLLGLFSAASLLLACLGLYAVVAYSARLRTREFGIRMAIGAKGRDVARLVLRNASLLTCGGLLLGLAMAWPVGRALESFLFGITSTDTVTLALAPAVLLISALLAGTAPAIKAARTDPAATLRAE